MNSTNDCDNFRHTVLFKYDLNSFLHFLFETYRKSNLAFSKEKNFISGYVVLAKTAVVGDVNYLAENPDAAHVSKFMGQ